MQTKYHFLNHVNNFSLALSKHLLVFINKSISFAQFFIRFFFNRENNTTFLEVYQNDNDPQSFTEDDTPLPNGCDKYKT